MLWASVNRPDLIHLPGRTTPEGSNPAFATEFTLFFKPGRTVQHLMSEHIKNVSDDSFETDVLGSETPVLVDYWAEWCGPCKMIAPVLEEVADEYADKMTVAKLNIDENPNTPPKYGIRGIPTLMMFKGGEVIATKVGALSKTQLIEFIQGNL